MHVLHGELHVNGLRETAAVQDSVAAAVTKILAHELLQIHATDTLRGIAEQLLEV